MLITDHLKEQRSDSPEHTRHAPRASEPRVLIADDQSDVLEALRLLLQAEGFTLETASSPAGVLAAVEAREFDVALVDLNYARYTTAGEAGLPLPSLLQRLRAHSRAGWSNPLAPHRGDRPDASRRRHARVALGRRPRRGDAPRRARLHPE